MEQQNKEILEANREEAKTLLQQNTDQIISAFSGQFSQLITVIELLRFELNEKVSNLTEKVENLTENIENLKEKVDNLPKNVSELTEKEFKLPESGNLTIRANEEVRLLQDEIKNLGSTIEVQFSILKVLVGANSSDTSSIKPSVLGTTKVEPTKPKSRATKKTIEAKNSMDDNVTIDNVTIDNTTVDIDSANSAIVPEEDLTAKPKAKPRARAVSTKTTSTKTKAKTNSEFAHSYMKDSNNLRKMLSEIGQAVLNSYCNVLNTSIDEMNEKELDDQINEITNLDDSNMETMIKSLNKLKEFKDYITQAQKIISNKDSLSEDA